MPPVSPTRATGTLTASEQTTEIFATKAALQQRSLTAEHQQLGEIVNEQDRLIALITRYLRGVHAVWVGGHRAGNRQDAQYGFVPLRLLDILQRADPTRARAFKTQVKRNALEWLEAETNVSPPSVSLRTNHGDKQNFRALAASKNPVYTEIVARARTFVDSEDALKDWR